MLKGLGFIDEIRWEGDATFGIHLRYVGFGAQNPHDPESSGEVAVGGVPVEATQTQVDAALEAAVKDTLVADHGFTFEVGDTVRILGGRLTQGS